MADNCPFWRNTNCAPPDEPSTHACSYAKPDYDNCAVYMMHKVKAAGGSMEDQLRAMGAISPGAHVVGGRGRLLSDDGLNALRSQEAPFPDEENARRARRRYLELAWGVESWHGPVFSLLLGIAIGLGSYLLARYVDYKAGGMVVFAFFAIPVFIPLPYLWRILFWLGLLGSFIPLQMRLPRPPATPSPSPPPRIQSK